MWNPYPFHHDQVFSKPSMRPITPTSRQLTTTTPTLPPLLPILAFNTNNNRAATTAIPPNFQAELDPHPRTRPVPLRRLYNRGRFRCPTVAGRYPMLAPAAGARPSTRGAVEQSPHSFRIGVNISQKCFFGLFSLGYK